MDIKSTTSMVSLSRICTLMLALFAADACAHTLTLAQAERIAVRYAPELKSMQAQATALANTAVAAGQLDDPKIMLGAMNLPTDTLSFRQEPMTQIQVGLQQSFPPGRTLQYKFDQNYNLSKAQCFRKELIRLTILRDVRMSWLNLHYWLHAKDITLKQKKVFKDLVGVTQSMLGNNKAQQKDVIRAQLELFELDNQLFLIRQNIETARAELARWIGSSRAREARPVDMPVWHKPPARLQLLKYLERHPVLKIDAAMVCKNQAGIKLSEQHYKPGFNTALMYGYRQGNNLDGGARADFLSLQVRMDLPIFTHNRQDRMLTASTKQLLASKEDQKSHYRKLRQALDTQLATWHQQENSVQIYANHIVPEARHYAKATMIAYQNTQTDFPTLARAYVRELNVEMAQLKADLNRGMARIQILYFQGR